MPNRVVAPVCRRPGGVIGYMETGLEDIRGHQ